MDGVFHNISSFRFQSVDKDLYYIKNLHIFSVHINSTCSYVYITFFFDQGLFIFNVLKINVE